MQILHTVVSKTDYMSHWHERALSETTLRLRKRLSCLKMLLIISDGMPAISARKIFRFSFTLVFSIKIMSCNSKDNGSLRTRRARNGPRP